MAAQYNECTALLMARDQSDQPPDSVSPQNSLPPSENSVAEPLCLPSTPRVVRSSFAGQCTPQELSTPPCQTHLGALAGNTTGTHRSQTVY